MFSSTKRDRLFYGAFEEHAARLVEAAKLLAEAFDHVERAPDLARQISEVEHKGDHITHETMKQLHKTWITPLDRADIHALITALDDVLDLTEAVSERVVLFEIAQVPVAARDLAQVLVRSCQAVEKAVTLLPTLDRSGEILDMCVEINRLENEADRLYRGALADLYRGGEPGSSSQGHHPLYVLKWRDIYDNLEAATDRCEDVANIVEGVVLEYA
jgi:predicted phosphate transport protein (TIGR00153 family)